MARKYQAGFTVVELMIAISVFAVVILLASIAIIQVGRMYQQGSTKTKLLEASRELHQDFAENIKYGADVSDGVSTLNSNSNVNVWCAGTVRYSWVLANPDGSNLDGANAARGSFTKDTVAGPSECESKAIDATASKPLPASAYVTDFSVGGTGPYVLTTRFAVGDNDLFEDNFVTNSCRSISLGGSYCAVVPFSSTVVKRIN